MKNLLDYKSQYQLEEFIEKKRNEHELGLAPIGEGLIKLVDDLNIGLIFYPKYSASEEKPFSAMYLSSKESNGQKISFIGVNTARYYDVQLFSIAHELYHHFENAEQFHFYHDEDSELNIRESQANYFAAAFMLPKRALEREIRESNDYKLGLNDWNLSTILRFVATLHLEYKLPYRAIILRLTEIKALTDEEKIKALLEQPTRDKESLYYHIAESYDKDTFALLNKKTERIGPNKDKIEDMIRNYENSLIDIDEFSNDLSLFNKKLEDYGLGENSNEMYELLEELEDQT